MDDDQLGEFAYDYVEVRRDYLAWTPAKEHHDAHTPVTGMDNHKPPLSLISDVRLTLDSLITAGDRHGIAAHSQMIEGHQPQVSPPSTAKPELEGEKSKKQ